MGVGGLDRISDDVVTCLGNRKYQVIAWVDPCLTWLRSTCLISIWLHVVDVIVNDLAGLAIA